MHTEVADTIPQVLVSEFVEVVEVVADVLHKL